MAGRQKKAKKSAPDEARYWVGIGASAGGLEALRAFVRNLPSNLNATYIVAQHLSPHHRSMLPEIIGRETEFEVLSVEDNVVPLPNKVYITPQNRDIEIDGNRLRIVSPSRDAGTPKPSVDRLFRSLAKEKKQDAIGIVLSGTGSDGARGIRDIHGAGGITIAQDEHSAKYTGMPVAAVESGSVDLVMSPEEIGVQFATILERRSDLSSMKSSPVHLDGVSELIHLVHNQCRVNFRHYKAATLQRRIERRMAAVGVDKIDDYVAIARSSEKEVNSLFKDFLISVTSFFRDPVEFEILKNHLSHLLETKEEKDQIRVWVPGSATGEEVYTIAMLIADIVGGADAFSKRKVQLFATDIDQEAIEIARRGYYVETALEEVPREFIDEYFEKVPTGYIVKKVIRERVVFSVHNVIQDPPFLNIDLISCRNLLIYFQSSLQSEVLSRFHYALLSNGLLFVGKSETTAANEALFKTSEHGKHIYFQRPSKARALFDGYPGRPRNYTPTSDQKEKFADVREITAANARFDSLIQAFGPDGFLIGADMQLRKAYGNVNPYINVSSGSMSLGISSLIKEPFGQDIRTAVPVVLRKKEVRQGIAHIDPENPDRRTRVTIYPIESGPDEELLALALISSWIATPAQAIEIKDDESSDLIRQNDELRAELVIAQANLQQTAEELETSNEELQALNEELQSSNEELQSTNEELETSNEELQSTNEELSTVNQELQVSSNELRLVNQSLNAILLNIGLPLIVVDRALNIVHISNASVGTFDVNPDTDLPHLSLLMRKEGFPDLVALANDAITTKRRIDKQIVTDNTNAVLSIVPNTPENGDVQGAIILAADNTDELIRTRNELQLIFDNIPLAIFARKPEGEILKANPAGQRIIGAEGIPLEGRDFFDFMDPDSAVISRQNDKRFFDGDLDAVISIGEFKYADGSKKWTKVTRVQSVDVVTDEPILYALGEDITEQHEAAEKLRISESRFDIAVGASKIGLWDYDVASGDLWWSDRFKEIVGVSDDTFSAKLEDFSGRLHPDDHDRIMKAVETHLSGNSPYDVTYRLRHEDGHYLWIDAKGQANWDADGNPISMIGTVEDVTERDQKFAALRESSGQLQAAAQLSGLGYWRVDLVNDGLIWSDQIYGIHGVSPDDYKPELETAIAFYHPDDVENVRSHISEAISGKKPFEFEARIVRPSGEVRDVKSIGEVNIDQLGATNSVFGVFIDVTDDRRREQDLRTALEDLSQSNEELNRFSYVCSHDMKEPVRLIQSMCDLLLEPSIRDDAKQRDDLIDRIGTNTKRLGAIINSLLAYSRIDEKVEQGDVDLNAVVDDIRDSLSLIIEESGVNLTAEPLPTVFGARVHFNQLLQNLVLNAIKFNESDKPIVAISAQEGRESTKIYVEDNGPGIPKDERENVFAVFKRLKLRDEIEGTGLGLSICQRIVQQYGGSIEVGESQSLGGAVFVITLGVEVEN